MNYIIIALWFLLKMLPHVSYKTCLMLYHRAASHKINKHYRKLYTYLVLTKTLNFTHIDPTYLYQQSIQYVSCGDSSQACQAQTRTCNNMRMCWAIAKPSGIKGQTRWYIEKGNNLGRRAHRRNRKKTKYASYIGCSANLPQCGNTTTWLCVDEYVSWNFAQVRVNRSYEDI